MANTPPVPPPAVCDLMTLSEIAIYLGRSTPFIYTLMAKHGLPALRIGNRWAFPKALVDAWILSRPGVNLPFTS
jgi:excisionase family DNA binding protein